MQIEEEKVHLANENWKNKAQNPEDYDVEVSGAVQMLSPGSELQCDHDITNSRDILSLSKLYQSNATERLVKLHR